MRSCFLFLGAISALVGVGMGAFGAHGLKAVLSVEQLTIFQTSVTYQMWHALGLLGIGIIYQQVAKSNLLIWAGWLMFMGIIIFSGSLYLLVLLDLKWLGMITPIGGVNFIVAWILIDIFAGQKQHHSRYTHESR